MDALIQSWNDCIDPRANINSFYNNVWNILTASTYGLDVWGRILVVSRSVQLPIDLLYFGFSEAGMAGFNDYPFWNGADSLTSPTVVDDSTYRTMLLAKALSNVCDGSILGINKILTLLFPSPQKCYVVDIRGMQMELWFEQPLTQLQVAILTQSNIIPIPCGVQALLVANGNPPTPINKSKVVQ